MRMSAQVRELLHELENIIGNECYNSNIQNYDPGGVWQGEGRSFRYPVSYTDRNNKLQKYRKHKPYSDSPDYPISYKILTKDEMLSAHYKVGANQLYIFRGLVDCLGHIEKNSESQSKTY